MVLLAFFCCGFEEREDARPARIDCQVVKAKFLRLLGAASPEAKAQGEVLSSKQSPWDSKTLAEDVPGFTEHPPGYQ